MSIYYSCFILCFYEQILYTSKASCMYFLSFTALLLWQCFTFSCSLPSRSWYLCRAESRTWNAGWKHSNYLSGQSNTLISNNMWAVISCFVIYRHHSEDILVVFSVYFQTKSTRQNDLQSKRVSLKHCLLHLCHQYRKSTVNHKFISIHMNKENDHHSL